MDLLLPTAGTFFDPPGKSGLASLTASLLTEGTSRRSAQEIAEAIDFVGGSLNASGESDAASITATVVKKDFALAMDLVADIAQHPAFRADEMDRKRQQLLSSLEVEYADAGYLATAVAARSLFGMHPYGLPEEGTPASVRALRREDVVTFHQQHYIPRGALLAIAGDVTPEEAIAAAEKYFGAWGGLAPEVTTPEIPPPPAGVRFVLVEKSGAVQTQIRAVRSGVARNSADYTPLFVANRIFGGGFNSRLNTRIRQQKGLTYGAFSQFNSKARAGSFVVGLSTKTESSVEAVRLVVELLGQMSRGDVTAQELAFAKDYLTGSFPLQSETPEQVAGRILGQALYGLPSDYYQRYRERIQAVGAEQIKSVAPRYFDPSGLSIVLVGNVGAFRQALTEVFPGARVEELPAGDIDLLASDLRRKPTASSAESGIPVPTRESIEQGRALLREAAKMAGGDALAAVKSLDLAANGKRYQQGTAADVELHLRIIYPDRMRLDMTTSFGSFSQGFDGTTAWAQFPNGVTELPLATANEFRRSILLSGAIGIAAGAQNGAFELQYLGEEEVEGKKALAALWRGPSGAVRLYVDSATHLLIAARFLSTTPQGNLDTLQLWDDFRPVEGVQYPFHAVIYENGVKTTETFTQQVHFNQPLDVSLFVKPSN
jgi:zinc protease